MKKTGQLYLLGLIFGLLLLGCGDENAPSGATITGPGDLTVDYIDNFNFSLDQTAAPLEFQVLASDGTTPVPGVNIRFFAGGEVIRLANRQGIALNPSDSFFFETETDNRGLPETDIYAVWGVPPCEGDPAGDSTVAGPDVTVTGSVEASIGVSTFTWTVTITSKGCMR